MQINFKTIIINLVHAKTCFIEAPMLDLANNL